MSETDVQVSDHRMQTPPATYGAPQSASTTPHHANLSPFGSPAPKSVAFELLFPESPQYRARLPMRVQIFPHDTTESIVTTVKNFYGLYAGPGGAKGVSFEDDQGNTLIARYENLCNNMVVYVRVVDELSQASQTYGPLPDHSRSPVMAPIYYPGDGYHMPPPAQALNYGQPLSRPGSRTSRKRSISPNGGRGRRSTSVSTNPPPLKKSRSRSGFKSRGSSTHGSFADNHSDAMNGYSSGDGAPGSVSSKTKSEHIGNTEISLDNIVEGGRRKRAKFESSVSSCFCLNSFPYPKGFSDLVIITGAAFVCSATNACCHFELFCLSSSTIRAPEGIPSFHESLTQPLLEPTATAISTKIRKWLWATWHIRCACSSWTSHSRGSSLSTSQTIN